MNLQSEGISLVFINSVCLCLGLLLSYLFRRHAARAYQALLFLILVAFFAPTLSITVNYLNWGMLTESPLEAFINLPQATTIQVEEPQSMRQTESSQEQSSTTTTTLAMQRTAETADSVFTIHWKPMLLILWITLTTGLLFRLWTAFHRGQTLVRRAVCPHDHSLQNTLNTVRQQLNLSNPVTLYSSDRIACPMIWCWSKNIAVVVPKTFLKSHESIDWNGIFCHELAHYKRKDHIHGLLTELLVCLLPWQPLIWWAKRRLVALSEEACDDWVMSYGHQEADYAESLLDMLPQRRMAFTPTIATHKSGLAQRVRRILAQKCSNPRMGLAWSCMVMLITVVGTLGIAFAQTRTVQPKQAAVSTDCRFCQNEKYGFYEGAIHGTVFDPNGDPVNEALVTILPITGFPAETTPEGHFHEIPYSLDWTRNGELTLLARYEKNNLTRSVMVSPATNEIEIYLNKGIVAEGKVVNSKGQPISGAEVRLDYLESYSCPMPIAITDTDDFGQFSIKALPPHRDYSLYVETDHMESGEIILNTNNLDIPKLILNEIILIPKEESNNLEEITSSWREAFDQAYQLKKDEIVKIVKAPFILERQDFCLEIHNNASYFKEALLKNQFVHFMFIWDGQLNSGGAFGWNAWSLGSLIQFGLKINSYEYEIIEGIGKVYLPHGDIVYLKDASTGAKLKALEPILKHELGRDLHFKKQILNKDVIVATGQFQLPLKPLPGWNDPNSSEFVKMSRYDPNVLYCPVGTGDQMSGLYGTIESLDDFFILLGHEMGIRIENQVTLLNVDPINYYLSGAIRLIRLAADSKRETMLPYVLDSLRKQTDLHFQIETQPEEIWVLTEPSD